MPTRERCLELRDEAFADDLEIEERMLSWTEEQVAAYFESGGQQEATDEVGSSLHHKLAKELRLTDLESTEYELDSARSSIDGWVVGGRDGASEAPTHAEMSPGDPLLRNKSFGIEMKISEEMGVEMIDEDELDVDGEERTEDALLDENPMSHIPVTRPPTERAGEAAPPSAYRGEATSEADGVGDWSIRQLKDFLVAKGADTTAFAEKREFVDEVRRLRRAGGDLPTVAAAGEADAAGATGVPSAKAARLLRKVEDIKASGDAAFRSKDFEKAERHYTSALARAAEATAEEALPTTLLATLFSNRSGTRAQLHRYEEALEDGRMALRHRPGWSRASCRVGGALVSLRRYEEAKEAYERGLRVDPGSSELQAGLTEVLGRMGKAAGGVADAAAAKEAGNAAFKAGRLEEAYTCYSSALAAAPSDEALYSNRSATLAKLGRYAEALDDGKRAISLQPQWGKAYSRAGFAALHAGDEEAAYWFYANGLKAEPSNAELVRGRDSTLAALASLASARAKRAVERFERDAHRPAARVFAVSDVHYDHPGAREWAQSLSRSAYREDALIVAGDVGDTYNAVRLALRQFKAVFRRVFYVPGNHDLWIRPAGQHSDEPARFADSVLKLLGLWQLCDELDVDVGPARLSPAVTVVPLDSWYHFSFDHFDPKPGRTLFDKFCKWPMPYDHVAAFMVSLNEAKLKLVETRAPDVAAGRAGHVITFSHFLPRKELPLPGVFEMAKASGCLALETQLRRVRSKMHVFGHTHLNTTNDYDGADPDGRMYTCTYVQNAMGYGIAPGTKLCVVHDKGHFKSYLA